MRKLYFFFCWQQPAPIDMAGDNNLCCICSRGKTIPPQALDFTVEVNACMETKGTLQNINSESHVNETISRDEENSSRDNATLALQMAEDLILQLPSSHEGRRQWLKLFGRSDEAKGLRK
jgi:hypothetical protein